MTFKSTMMRPPAPVLAAISLTSFALLAVLADHAQLPGICGQLGAAILVPDKAANLITLIVAFNSPLRLIGEWALMLGAMMPLVLIGPIRHVQRSSLQRRRARAVAVFAIGYALVWFAVAPILLSGGILLRLLLGGETVILVVVMAAFFWSSTPMHRRALNLGHKPGRIGLFGIAADCDCAFFGMRHGLYCVAVCTPWMIVPMVADGWHFPAMVLVTGAMIIERFERVMRPHWRIPPVLQWLRFKAKSIGSERIAYG